MQTIDLSFAKDPNTLTLALIAGVLPAVLWIFFWIRENRERPRRAGILFSAFLAGVFMVILALPVEKFMLLLSSDATTLTVLWAASEEVLKFCAFLMILFWTTSVEVPIDYPVYMMVVALGFAGFENALYFLQPLQSGSEVTLFLSSSMRFLGSTLMHAAVSSLAGIGLGFAYFGTRRQKILAAALGLTLAIAIHSTFNLIIPEMPDMTFVAIIASLWLLTVIIMILLENLRKRGSAEYLRAHRLGLLAGSEAVFNDLLHKTGMTPADSEPILAGLTKKAISPEAPEHAELSSLIETMRTHYAAYIFGQGAKKEDAAKTARTLIPETVSPKALTGIFTVLKA